MGRLEKIVAGHFSISLTRVGSSLDGVLQDLALLVGLHETPTSRLAIRLAVRA